MSGVEHRSRCNKKNRTWWGVRHACICKCILHCAIMHSCELVLLLLSALLAIVIATDDYEPPWKMARLMDNDDADPWAFRQRQRAINNTAAEDLLFGPWTVLEAVLMGIPLLPSPPVPRPATHRLPFHLMPIPQPRTPRITITPAQCPSGTYRASSGSNVATVAPVQPSISTGRATTCRRPCTAEPEVDVARQRIRELVLDRFLQTQAPMECTMGPLVSMSTLRVELRDILWFVDHLLDDTRCDHSLLIAYALWREVRSSLEGLLVGIGESMESAALRDPDDDPEEPEPSPPARHVRCCVCMDRLVGLRPCGHALCG
ncbi:hypothetical protein J6590_092529 [Homalodisca vitripennis]|nr:hypothetical protein J6590_092529 [Homalodisca vitripennis]